MKPRAMNLSGELLPPSLVGVMILLDRSGSMTSIKGPMEEAFARFLAEQRAMSPDGMWLSLHQFDSGGYDVVYDRTPLAQVGTLQLIPRGGTPLIDALYRIATDARQIVDDPTDPTERLLLVVITDGQENQSHEHTWAQVRELMQGLNGTDVETIWLGTSDAILEAQAAMPDFAQAGATLRYAATADGVAWASAGLSSATSATRSGISARAVMADYVAIGDGEDAQQAVVEKIRQAAKKA